MAQEKKQAKKKIEKKEPSGEVKKIRMKVVGIGNGGNAIVADISQSIGKAKFIVANTDKRLLSKLQRRKKIKTFQFGKEITEGFGTGMDFNLGRQAAEKNIEKIEKILGNCDLCILVSCLGGGTGSGATPIFAQISKKLGNLTYGIFTLPFKFEGKKKLEIAEQALKDLEPFVNAITIIPNERIFKMVDKKLPLKQALSKINKILAFNLEGVIDVVYKPGLINIDFADLKTILRGQGQLAYLNRTQAQGEGRAKKALQEVLSSPLYSYDTTKAKKVLFDISGPVNLSIAEVSGISRGIFKSVKQSAKIIFGVSHQTKKDSIEISLLAVDCEEQRKENIKDKNLPVNQEPVKQKIQKKRKIKPLKTKENKTEPEKQKNKKHNSKQPRVRKSALQVKKAIQDLEEEIKNQEEIWQSPAFLRRKQ